MKEGKRVVNIEQKNKDLRMLKEGNEQKNIEQGISNVEGIVRSGLSLASSR